MKKEEIIERYGEEAYEKVLGQARAYYRAHKVEAKANKKKYNEEHKKEENARVKKYQEEHKEEVAATKKEYRKANPEQVEKIRREQARKGGKYYAKKLEDDQTGLRGKRNRIRKKHGNKYRPYKQIIAPNSQLHHEWVPDTSDYRGVALVEADQHMHGFVDVIEILAGKITLRTEEEVNAGGRKSGN